MKGYKVMWRNIKEYIMSEIVYMSNTKRRKEYEKKLDIFQEIYGKMINEEISRKERKWG